MADELETCEERIDALAACPRQVVAEASFTPGDDYRPVVKLVIAAAEALEPPVAPDRLDDLRLAVTEACSNAVKVHRKDALAEPIVVSFHIDEAEVRVEVHDRGPGFDPSQRELLPEPEDPERLQHEHGLGVDLICELADDVTFRPEPGGTVVAISLRR